MHERIHVSPGFVLFSDFEIFSSYLHSIQVEMELAFEKSKPLNCDRIVNGKNDHIWTSMRRQMDGNYSVAATAKS
jgi:hypothetical protein